jgi:hypothetical protein
MPSWAIVDKSSPPRVLYLSRSMHDCADALKVLDHADLSIEPISDAEAERIIADLDVDDVFI